MRDLRQPSPSAPQFIPSSRRPRNPCIPKAQKAFQQARVNPEQVKKAVSGLSDRELAQLSQRATKAQRDFAAGDISTEMPILILVAVLPVILLSVYV